MAIETVTTFADLLTLLAEKRVPHQADVSRQLVEMPAKAPPLDDVLYVRWEKNLPYVQLVAPLVRNIAADRTNDVVEALTRLNDKLPWGTVGFEYDLRFVYLRRCIPVYEEGIPATWFEREVAMELSIGNAEDWRESADAPSGVRPDRWGQRRAVDEARSNQPKAA